MSGSRPRCVTLQRATGELQKALGCLEDQSSSNAKAEGCLGKTGTRCAARVTSPHQTLRTEACRTNRVPRFKVAPWRPVRVGFLTRRHPL